jgi:hypothetical protein
VTWRVEAVARRRTTLDFTSSGQGRYDAIQVLLDGELFANAVGLSSWDADDIQVLVCTECGIEHCKPGDWVALRSAGDLKLFIPLFGAAQTEDERIEYGPPRVLRRHGAPLLEPPAYGRMREFAEDLPKHAPPITAAEAAHLLSFEAPPSLRIQERTGPEVARRLHSAGDFDVSHAVEALYQLINDCSYASRTVSVRPLGSTDRPVTFRVGNATRTGWTPMVMTLDGPAIHWSGWVVEHDP